METGRSAAPESMKERDVSQWIESLTGNGCEINSVFLTRHPNGKPRRLMVTFKNSGPTAEGALAPEL